MPATSQPPQPSFHDLGGLKVGTVPLETLKQRRTNYRHMDDRSYAALQSSIKKFGFKSFVVVVQGKEQGTFEVIDGHHRWQAARDLKMPNVPVVLLEGADADGADLAMLSFNVTAEIIPDVYLDFLKELDSRVGADTLAAFTGLDDTFLKDLNKTLQEVKVGDIQLGLPGDESDRSRGAAINASFPNTPEVVDLLNWAQSYFQAKTPAEGIIACLKDARSKVVAG